MIVAPGASSVSVDVFFADDTGAAVTGKVAADFPACKWSSGGNTADTTITLSDLAAITTAHPNDNTAGGVKEREGGYYRLDLPNNMFTAAGHKGLTFAETTNKRIIVERIDVQYVQSNVQQVAGAAQTAKDLGALNVTNVNTLAGHDPGGTLASQTNITGGVITTTTNLTNAPGAGDFTAAMKTSLNSATPAVTVSDKTGFSLSGPGVQAIWDALTSALTTVGSVGKRLVDFVTTLVYAAPPSAAANASALLATALTQRNASALSTSTVEDALSAARAQGSGAWTLVGTTLTLKNPDGTTFRAFTLDSSSAPTTRT